MRLVEGSHPLEGFLCHMPTNPASGVAGGTTGLQRTAIAYACLGSILLKLLVASGREDVQFGPIRTNVDVTLRIVVEVPLTEERASLIKIGERNIRTNVLLFEGRNNFSGSVGGISSKLPWPQFPAEAGSPEQVQDRLIFHHARKE